MLIDALNDGISLKDLEGSVEEEVIFIMKKYKTPLIRFLGMYYAIDVTGFPLLSWEVVELRI